MVKRRQQLAVMMPPFFALLIVIVVFGIVHTDDDLAKVTTEYPRIACSIRPAGNERTVEFLKWARTNHPLYAYVELDDHGDIVRLDVEICYHVTDDELKVIAKLPRLNELAFYSAEVTDVGLEHLEATKSLKRLAVDGASQQKVTRTEIQQLERANPLLNIQLSYK